MGAQAVTSLSLTAFGTPPRIFPNAGRRWQLSRPTTYFSAEGGTRLNSTFSALRAENRWGDLWLCPPSRKALSPCRFGGSSAAKRASALAEEDARSFRIVCLYSTLIARMNTKGVCPHRGKLVKRCPGFSYGCQSLLSRSASRLRKNPARSRFEVHGSAIHLRREDAFTSNLSARGGSALGGQPATLNQGSVFQHPARLRG